MTVLSHRMAAFNSPTVSVHPSLPPTQRTVARTARRPLEIPMFQKNTITAAINTILLGPVGVHLSYSGYIIAAVIVFF